MKKQIVNLKTGLQTVEEFSAEDIENYKTIEQKIEKEKAKKEAANAEKEALKKSANDKLAALGLTPEEIAAITK